MKRVILSLLFLAGVLGLNAQRNVNDANAEKRTVPSFHGIEVSTGIKLILTSGDAEAVAVSASKPEFVEHIVTKVENGILKIYYQKKINAINSNRENKDLKAYVSYKMLDQLDANTGARVEIEGTLKSASVRMNVNTGAMINGRVDIGDLSVDQNTGSIVTLTGEAGKLKVEGDTGSIFKGSDLKTDNCNASCSTGAGIYIRVEKELYAKANTGGFVKYSGNAGIREVKTNSGGQVKKI